MDKVEFVEIEQVDGKLETFAIIDKGNGEFASMTKARYEELQAQQVEHLTEIVADEAEAK